MLVQLSSIVSGIANGTTTWKDSLGIDDTLTSVTSCITPRHLHERCKNVLLFKDLYNVYNFICNSSNLETNPMSIKRWIDIYTAVKPCNGILLSNGKG
jgi:hypothetical protein